MVENAYNAILEKTFEQHIPLTAHWELTYRCNLSCVHCYTTNRGGIRELTTQQVCNGLEQLADAGSLFLAFTGGEVFCRDDLFDILEFASEKRFAWRLFTNGTLITRDVAEKISTLGPVGVEITLHATDSAVHDSITKLRGSHRRTVDAIGYCCEQGIAVTVKSCIFRNNVHEFEAVKDFAAAIGAQFKFDLLLVPADDGSRPMDIYGLSEDELYEFILTHGTEPGSPPVAPNGTEPLCGAGANMICVSPAGDADRVFHANVLGKPGFQLFYFRAHDKSPVIQHSLYTLVYLLAHEVVLRF